jgi:Ser/Thr protein kinase RdoA (MazF antagonist)
LYQTCFATRTNEIASNGVISIIDIRTIVGDYPADYQPQRVEPLGSAGGMSGAQFWRIESQRGALMLRRWPTEHPSPERLRFIHAVLFHAADRGVGFLPVPIRTISGKSFVNDADHLWEIAPWMPGIANYEHAPSNEKLASAMRAIAQLHRAVHDFPLSIAASAAAEVPAISRRLARLKKLSSGEVAELLQSIRDAAWPEMALVGRRFVAILPRLMPRAYHELESLAHIRLPLQPCLRDIWHDHVLFTGEVVTGIVDFGGMDIDTPATDVARLLGSLVGDDAAGWQTGVAAYKEVRPLTEDEERAAKILDVSGTILAGCNWLRWIYTEGRNFENRAHVLERFYRIVARCEHASAI